MNLSLQLWSVKDDTEKDFFGTLKEVAEMGYKGVEFAGYGGKSAAEMKAKLDEYGLKATGSHIPLDRFENNLAEEIEYNKTIGNEYLICPWAEFKNRAALDNVSAILNNASAEAKKHGLKVGYHNHDQEFGEIDGEVIMDSILKNCPDIIFEIDIHWVTFAGLNAVEYIKKCGERAEIIHLKQIKDKKGCDFPEGEIDMFAIVDASKFAKYFIVEQETWEVLPAMRSARRNVEFMKGAKA